MVGSGPSPGRPLSLRPPLGANRPLTPSKCPEPSWGPFRSSPEPLPAHSRLRARPSSGPRIHSPFKWSLLPGAVGPGVPAARSPAGVVWRAPVCDLSATLAFAMATAGEVDGAAGCRAPLTTRRRPLVTPRSYHRSQVPGDHLTSDDLSRPAQ